QELHELISGGLGRRLVPMSRLSIATAVAVAASLLAPAALATQARLAVVAKSPFTVRGAHFKPAERVRVVVTSTGGTGTRSGTAGSTGAFLLRFRTISLGSCPAYSVRATGNLGSRATLK